MNLSPTLAQEFNAQFNQERYNEAFYLQASYLLESITWDGMAKWLMRASDEEREHARGFASFLIDRNVAPALNVLDAGFNLVANPLYIFQEALRQEQGNTERLKALEELCDAEDDEDADIFLQTYMTEQRKSERELTDILNLLNRAVNSNAAMLEIDERLGESSR